MKITRTAALRYTGIILSFLGSILIATAAVDFTKDSKT